MNFQSYEMKVVEEYAKLLRKKRHPKPSQAYAYEAALGAVLDSGTVKRWFKEGMDPWATAEIMWRERFG